MDASVTATETLQRLAQNIGQVMRGQSEGIRLLLAGFVSGGHVLLEDFPGTGKTTLAKALARSVDLDFQRAQFTPDLLPSDILGVSIFDQRRQDFEFRRGPIFTDVLLADEINRASPRTQSALLEAMAEGQVSIDGDKHGLSDVFFVIATQNPVEFHGTYPLPEAQMDRFALQLALGYVETEDEIAILDTQRDGHPLDSIEGCADLAGIMAVRQAARAVPVANEIKRYIVELVASTRTHAGVRLGASPRASLALMHAAQALALFDGDSVVTPDHVHTLAIPVIAHRLVLDSEAKFSGRNAAQVIAECQQSADPPR